MGRHDGRALASQYPQWEAVAGLVKLGELWVTILTEFVYLLKSSVWLVCETQGLTYDDTRWQAVTDMLYLREFSS